MGSPISVVVDNLDCRGIEREWLLLQLHLQALMSRKTQTESEWMQAQNNCQYHSSTSAEVCLFYFKAIHTRSHTIGILLQETMAHCPQLYVLIKKMTVVVDNNRRPCPPYVDDKDVACVVWYQLLKEGWNFAGTFRPDALVFRVKVRG